MAKTLRAMTGESEPVAVTLSQLRRWPVKFGGNGAIFLFENPSLLIEAAGRGWKGPPLACTSGWPNAAVLSLLRQLSSENWTMRVHADFDVGGIRIVNTLMDRLKVLPWRMGASDYLRLVDGSTKEVSGDVPRPVWDAQLEDAIRTHNRVVFEEDMREDLLNGLWMEPTKGSTSAGLPESHG